MKKDVGLILLLFPVLLCAQKADTLQVNQLNKISLSFTETDSAKALFYARKALAVAQQLQWEEGLAKSNFQIGSIYNVHFDFDRALIYFKKSLKITDPKSICKIYLNIGGIYTNKSDFSKALDYLLRALKIAETRGDLKNRASITTNIGSVYYGIQKYQKALVYFNKAAEINEQLGNTNDQAIVARNIGGVYNSLHQPQKALEYYEKASAMSKKSNNRSLQSRILSDLALLHYNLGNYDQAITNCHLSLQAETSETLDSQTLAFTRGVLGDSYIEKAKLNPHQRFLLDSAMANLNKAVKLHRQLNSSRDLAYDFSSMTQVHKLRGDFKSALASYETAMVYEDSVFNFENKETIKNLEDKRAIELRDRELKINKLQLEAKERQKWMLLCGMVLLSVIGGLLFYQSYNRRKTNRKLRLLNQDLEQKNTELDQANKIKARFFSILNHDLRSPVYNLIHFLHLQKESPDLLDAATKAKIEYQTTQSAENLLSSMDDMLLWSKGQMENFRPQPERISIGDLFEDLQKHFTGTPDIAFVFENPDDIEVETDMNYLKTILRNLTSNAIKALSNTADARICWKAWRSGSHDFLSIADNGKGATEKQFRALYDETEVVGIKTGLGLHLIRDLAKAIQGTIEVETQEKKGTTLTLSLPAEGN